MSINQRKELREMSIKDQIEALSHDGERYAEILKLEKELKEIKDKIRPNVIKTWGNYAGLSLSTRKVFKVDPESRYGRDIKNLKTAIKELEDQAKVAQAGSYEEVVAIGLQRGKAPKPQIQETPATGSKEIDYSQYFGL